MTDLISELEAKRIVVVDESRWKTIAPTLAVTERYRTVGPDDLLIIQTTDGHAAVEKPDQSTRVVRLFSNSDEKDRFVARRQEQYELFWDGCGCRIDYFEESVSTE